MNQGRLKEIALVHPIKTICDLCDLNDHDVACIICHSTKKDYNDKTMKFVSFTCCPKVSWCRSCYFVSRDYNHLYCICKSPLQNDVDF